MKKVILSLAVIVAISIPSFASNDNKTENKASCAQTTCCAATTSCTQGKEKVGKADKAFEGLNLTAEQQTKLAELRKNRMADKGRVPKEKRDSVKGNLTVEQKKQLMEERQAKRLEARKKYLESVKAILTPEQYDKFLENSYLSKVSERKSGKMHVKKANGKRGMKKADRKDCKCGVA